MKIVDRYIVREFIPPFICCLFVFISLYVIIDAFGRLEDVVKNHIALTILLQYYLAFLPIIFVRTAPVAALLAALHVLGNLTRYNEITAFKASGINIWRLCLPFFYLGLFISITTLAVNEKIVPQANFISATVKETYLDKGEQDPKEKVIKNIALYGTRNRLIHVRAFFPQKNLLQGITILEQNDQAQVTAKIQAKSALWVKNRWEFFDCVVYTFSRKGQTVDRPSYYKKMLMDIEEKPKDFLRRESSAEFMSYRKLSAYIRKLAGSGAKIVQRLRVQLYYKVSFPFVSLVIIFLGIPFALSAQGKGNIANVGLCILIAFFYYSVEALSLALGKGGTFPPFLSAWFANILFGIVAIMLMRHTPK